MSVETRSSGAAAAVTPSDTTSLLDTGKGDGLPRALYVGTGGDVNVEFPDTNGDTVLFSSVPTGAVLSIRPLRVFSTNTTASDIVALY